MKVREGAAVGWSILRALAVTILFAATVAPPARSTLLQITLGSYGPDLEPVEADETVWIDPEQTFIGASPTPFGLGRPMVVCLAPSGSNYRSVDCIHYVSPDAQSGLETAIVDLGSPSGEVPQGTWNGNLDVYSVARMSAPASDYAGSATMANPIACNNQTTRCVAEPGPTGTASAAAGDETKRQPMSLQDLIQRIPAVLWGAVLLIALALLRG
jgi:hypothetical protein